MGGTSALGLMPFWCPVMKTGGPPASALSCLLLPRPPRCRAHGAPPEVLRWFIDHLTGPDALQRKAQVGPFRPLVRCTLPCPAVPCPGRCMPQPGAAAAGKRAWKQRHWAAVLSKSGAAGARACPARATTNVATAMQAEARVSGAGALRSRLARVSPRCWQPGGLQISAHSSKVLRILRPTLPCSTMRSWACMPRHGF